ncbi:hypothetical protein Tco_1249034, partial [Tanacetum coccineum]
MVSTMTTRNAGRRTAATRGEGTSEQDGREGDRSGDQVGRGKGGQSGRGSQGGGQDSQESDQGSQGCSRGNGANRGGGGVPNFATIIAQQLQNLLPTIEDFKTLTIEEFCPNNEMQKLETEFWYHVMVEASHAAYTDRFHRLASLAPQIRAMVATTELTIIQSAVLKAEMLTDEEIKNGALKKISKKRGNNGEPSRDRNVRDDNKRSKTGRAFSIITNPVRKEYTGAAPKYPNCNYHHQPEVPCHLCTNFNRSGTLPKIAGWGLAMAVEGGQGRGNNGNQARRRAIMIGGEEARQDPNIVT